MTLEKFLNFSISWFLYFEYADNRSTYAHHRIIVKIKWDSGLEHTFIKKQFTPSKIHRSQVCHSMNFGSCVHLCRHLPKQNTAFCHYIMFLMSLPVSYHPHKQLFSGLHHHVLFLPLLELHVSKQTLCIVLCLSSFTQHNILETHVCCCLFFLIAKEQYSIIQLHHYIDYISVWTHLLV